MKFGLHIMASEHGFLTHVLGNLRRGLSSADFQKTSTR